ncbi:MAG: chaperone modulator CbpM, partial [Bacteroidia bacterium]
YIDPEQLQKLESFLRMHYEMDINMEGIEAIAHLLQRTQSMQEEILKLKNRLRLYEDEQI